MNLRLRTRISLYFVGATGLLMAFVFAVIYVVVSRSVYAHLDEDLRAESLEVFHGIIVLSNDIVIANPGEWTEKEHGQVEVNPVFVQIVDTLGVPVRRTPNLHGTPLPFEPRLRKQFFYEAEFAGSTVRVVQIPVTNPQAKILGFVIVAIPADEPEIVLRNLRLVLIVTFPLALFLLYGISTAIAGQNIAPVENIIGSAESITSLDLDRRIAVPERQDELNRLATTINRLVERLQDVLVRERQFTADASHELRTPLAAIRGTLDVLQRRPRTQEHYEEKIRFCIGEVDRMSGMVEQLLSLARYDSGAVRPKIASFDIVHGLFRLRERMSAVLQAKDIVANMVADPVVRVMADPDLTDIILGNVLSNAVKYSPPGSFVDIRIVESTSRVEVAVSDRGIGIAKDHLGKVFDRFYRSDVSRASDIEGVGLGLTIVKRLADLQSLTVEIESELGKGTTVRIGFPHGEPVDASHASEG